MQLCLFSCAKTCLCSCPSSLPMQPTLEMPIVQICCALHTRAKPNVQPNLACSASPFKHLVIDNPFPCCIIHLSYDVSYPPSVLTTTTIACWHGTRHEPAHVGSLYMFSLPLESCLRPSLRVDCPLSHCLFLEKMLFCCPRQALCETSTRPLPGSSQGPCVLP